MLHWAHAHGFARSERSEAALLDFFAATYSLHKVWHPAWVLLGLRQMVWQVVGDALLCHMAPQFSVSNAARFAQLPVAVMGSLLASDDLEVTSELQVPPHVFDLFHSFHYVHYLKRM